ncbi:hypothetical protein D9M68_787530 [compost metagenome]
MTVEFVKLLKIVLVTLFLSSCGSIQEHSSGCTWPYSGVESSYKASMALPPITTIVFFPDLLFSAALDTVLLPFDATCR